MIEDILIVERLSKLYRDDLRRNWKLSTLGYSGKDIKNKCDLAVKIAEDTAKRTRRSVYPRNRLTKKMEEARNIPPKWKHERGKKVTEADKRQ